MTEPAKVVRALWDGLNNTQRVNANLLREQDVETLDVEGKAVIRVAVPRATRRQRPVYVGQNPLTGSFRRNNEGDYRCPEEVVRRMIAEQVEDTRDAHVLRGFGVGDLDTTTIAKYRQRYQTRSPDHPWNSLDEKEFLRSIGAFGSDREAGIEGLTSAGLLMFGKLVPIKDAFPNYMLDFQERADARPDSRWVDRLTTDGTWSGNLFDFYALAIQRLFRDLRVPFQLRGDTRIDETPVHEALREALVNTLIHADYTGRVSVLVVKRSDLFAFRNPGAMRMPVETALRGGVSDCRNRRLQDMFRYVGLGEQAGSGIPKIQSAWRTQHWRSPEMVEQVEPYEQTIGVDPVSWTVSGLAVWCRQAGNLIPDRRPRVEVESVHGRASCEGLAAAEGAHRRREPIEGGRRGAGSVWPAVPAPSLGARPSTPASPLARAAQPSSKFAGER